MESSPPVVEYQSSQVCVFMAGINKDLEDHVLVKSAKYNFNFQKERPIGGPKSDIEWEEVSDFSKSEVAVPKPRINVQPDRKSTADTTLHSIQPEVLSARGLGLTNTSTFSGETLFTPNFAQRQSLVFPEPTSQRQQICFGGQYSSASVQRFAATSAYSGKKNQNNNLAVPLVSQNDCIREERESTPSPDLQFYPVRESLAERPGSEGPIRSPVNLTRCTPFAAQASHRFQRKITTPKSGIESEYISNCSSSLRLIEESENNESCANAADESDDVVTRLRELHVECLDDTTQTRREADYFVDAGTGAIRIDTESEFDKELDEDANDVAEQIVGDGPSDSVSGLKVYSNAQHFTNI